MAFAGGCGQTTKTPCELSVYVELDGITASADTLQATARVGDALFVAHGSHALGATTDMLAIAFPGGYPAGQTATIAVDAIASGRLVATTTTTPTVLSPECTSVSATLHPSGADALAFVIAPQRTIMGGAASLAAADFDGDGALDLVVGSTPAMEAPPSVALLLADGKGGFLPPKLFSTGAYAIANDTSPTTAVAVADVDHDGRLDVVAVNPRSKSLSVLRNDGHGGLAAPTVYPFSQPIWSVALADFDGDPSVDIATVNVAPVSMPASVSVLLNHGDGTFAAAAQYPVGGNGGMYVDVTPVAAADIDNDDKLDLVVGVPGQPQVATLLNRGDGTFAAPIFNDAGVYPYALAVADLDGDGVSDCVAVDGGYEAGGTDYGGRVSVLITRGHGSFAPAVTYLAEQPQHYAFGVAVADYDGDGKQDLIARGDGLTLLRNVGGGSFVVDERYVDPAAQTIPVFGLADDVAVADFDGDGKLDFVLPGGNGLTTLRGEANHGFYGIAQFENIYGPALAMAVGDFNRDGKLDLASAGLYEDVSVYFGNGNGAVQDATHYVTGPQAAGLAAGDLDGDGAPDLVVVDNTNDPTTGGLELAVLINPGDGRFGAAARYDVGPYPTAVALGDVDGDGKRDVLVAVGASVLVLRNLGNGVLAAPVAYDAGTVPTSLVVADLNGDGRSDVAVAGHDVLNVMLADGSGALGSAVTWATGLELVAVGAADLDGDGHPDLVANDERRSGPIGLVFVVLGNRGDGSFPTQVVWPGGATALADLDGDGAVDVVDRYALTVHLNDGRGGFAQSRNFPTSSGVSWIAADVDGDGRIDLIDTSGTIVRNATP